MLAAPPCPDELIAERFPEIAWEHSHIVATDDGEIVTYLHLRRADARR